MRCFYFATNGLAGALCIDETVRVIIQMYGEELISIRATIKANRPLSRCARATPNRTHKVKTQFFSKCSFRPAAAAESSNHERILVCCRRFYRDKRVCSVHCMSECESVADA